MSHPRRPLAVSAALAVVVTLIAAFAATSPAGAAGNGSATWDVSSYVAGTDKLEVHGTVPGGRRRVHLQVQTKSGWRNLETERTRGNGSYRLAGRLDWYGTHKVRVFSPGRPAFAMGTRASVSTGYTPVGTASDYALFGPTIAKTWRFDPCSVVTYKVNVDDVGASAIPLVQRAMQEASRASGIRVRYTGTTSYLPYSTGSARRTPKGTRMVIGFGTDAEVPVFTRKGFDGYGGQLWGFSARDAQGRRVVRTTDAGAVIRTESYLQNYDLAFESGARTPVGNLLLHEIGHAFGLDHAAGADEMMFGSSWAPDADGVFRSRYAAGDLTGFDKIGYGQGCLRQIRGRLAPLAGPAPRS